MNLADQLGQKRTSLLLRLLSDLENVKSTTSTASRVGTTSSVDVLHFHCNEVDNLVKACSSTRILRNRLVRELDKVTKAIAAMESAAAERELLGNDSDEDDEEGGGGGDGGFQQDEDGHYRPRQPTTSMRRRGAGLPSMYQDRTEERSRLEFLFVVHSKIVEQCVVPTLLKLGSTLSAFSTTSSATAATEEEDDSRMYLQEICTKLMRELLKLIAASTMPFPYGSEHIVAQQDCMRQLRSKLGTDEFCSFLISLVAPIANNRRGGGHQYLHLQHDDEVLVEVTLAILNNLLKSQGGGSTQRTDTLATEHIVGVMCRTHCVELLLVILEQNYEIREQQQQAFLSSSKEEEEEDEHTQQHPPYRQEEEEEHVEEEEEQEEEEDDEETNHEQPKHNEDDNGTKQPTLLTTPSTPPPPSPERRKGGGGDMANTDIAKIAEEALGVGVGGNNSNNNNVAATPDDTHHHPQEEEEEEGVVVVEEEEEVVAPMMMMRMMPPPADEPTVHSAGGVEPAAGAAAAGTVGVDDETLVVKDVPTTPISGGDIPTTTMLLSFSMVEDFPHHDQEVAGKQTGFQVVLDKPFKDIAQSCVCVLLVDRPGLKGVQNKEHVLWGRESVVKVPNPDLPF